jgi:hypothetical protein
VAGSRKAGYTSKIAALSKLSAEDRMNWKRGLIFASVVMFCSAGHAQQVNGSGHGPGDLIGVSPSRQGGAWRTRVQQLFEPSTRSLIRKTITVWQSVPQGDLDFEWVPDRVAEIADGRAAGNGKLIWRDRTRPSYDETAVVAEYRGTLAEGRMQGSGRYVDRSGLSYEGQWTDGLMEGRGRLQLPGGSEYEGQFRNGRAEGAGTLIDTTGERYEGDFKAGLRSGVGTTTLPNGRSYLSHWANGQESERSHLIRIAQNGGKLPGGDDIRIGIGIEQKFPTLVDTLDPGDLAYSVVNDPVAFRIRPSSRRLMDMWLGKGDLKLSWVEENSDGGGVVSLAKTQIIPLRLRIEVQNRSSTPLQLAGLYLDVGASQVERKPALQIGMGGMQACDTIGYVPRFRIENLGWGKAEAAKMRLAATQTGGSSSFSFPIQVGDIDKKADIDLVPALKAAGVDTSYLASIDADGFPCVAQDKASAAACLKKLQATGKFGILSRTIEVKDTTFFTALAGNLDYSWQDAGGEKHDWSSPFSAIIPLGHFKIEAECGEGGRPQVVVNKTQQFKLDQSNYRIPVSFQATVPAGQNSVLLVPVEALKSSNHRFKVVLQLTNGREVASRPIELLYYRPSWFKDSAEEYAAAKYGLRISNRDLIGTELLRLQTVDSEVCEKACAEQSTCMGYSLNQAAKICSLKSSATAERLDIDYFSFLKKGQREPPELDSPKTMEIRQGTTLGGVDRAYLVETDSSPADCERRCMAENQCSAFDFSSDKRLCYLLNEPSDPQNDPKFASGIKHQSRP